MNVRLYPSCRGHRISINGALSSKYWVEKQGKYALRNKETFLWGFTHLKDVILFIEKMLGNESFCGACKQSYNNEDISVWQDYATGTIYNVCPKCNGILEKT